MYYEVIPTTTFKKSPLFSDGLLTYSFDQNLAPGTIVSIPLGKKTVLGIIYRKTTAPTDQNFIIKSINKIVHPIPLPNHLLKSLAWLSSYYLNPVAKTANLFLPLGIEKNRRKKSITTTTANTINATLIKAATTTIITATTINTTPTVTNSKQIPLKNKPSPNYIKSKLTPNSFTASPVPVRPISTSSSLAKFLAQTNPWFFSFLKFPSPHN